MYVMVCTMPDIAHAVGVVSRYMSHPRIKHWNAVKWILRYLRGTSNKCLHFGGSTTDLQSYVDSDLAGDIDTRRSTTGYVFTIGGAAMSWVSRLQKINALYTIEAEYVAAKEVAKEMILLQFFVGELGHPQMDNFFFLQIARVPFILRRILLCIQRQSTYSCNTISFGWFCKMGI